MDSDLAESIQALRASLGARDLTNSFGKADPGVVAEAHRLLRIPRRYREFLLACDPVLVEAVTPGERIRLIASSDLLREQKGFSIGSSGELLTAASPAGWRPAWVLVAQSLLLGDPYFLDTSRSDPEGDCPVFTAMSGKETWQPRLCASSFALFLRILATSVDVARGFDAKNYDVEDEQVFREALGPRIREFDPAAAKAGHWT